MMKLKRYLKSLARAGLGLNILAAASLFLCGCDFNLEPTYTEEDIPRHIKTICKDEYGLDVVIKRTNNTLWVYGPSENLLHKDYGKQADKIFDDAIIDKLRQMLNTISRVLISSDAAPEFFVLTISDINIGLDYSLVGYVLDIRKSYSGSLPWSEANKRYVISFRAAPEAIGDKTGAHIEFNDLIFPNFLAEQAAQRIDRYFQSEELKEKFETEPTKALFLNGIFMFGYSAKLTTEEGEETNQENTGPNVMDEISNIICYVLQTYEFGDFYSLQIKDMSTQEKLTLTKEEALNKQIR